MKKTYLIPIALLMAGYAGNLQAQNIVNSGGARFVVGAGTTVITGNLTNTGTNSAITNSGTIKVSGDFSQTSSAIYFGDVASWLEFNGTALQTIGGDATMNISRVKINGTVGGKLTQPINVDADLNITSGDLDLNGKDVDLGGSGILTEDRANNHLVVDKTATNDANQGGAVVFSATVDDVSEEIRGTGLYLQTQPAQSYPVTVRRLHYRGAIASRGGYGIARIYQITGTPTDITTMRIYYASDEIVGSGTPADFVIYRWHTGIGWKNATTSGSYNNGTNDLVTQYVEAINIASFSHWTVGSSVTPLPISLLGFRGARAGESELVNLSWETATETGNKGFEVEASTDGRNYRKIAFVEGKGNSSEKTAYQLNANNADDAYYRLKQIDFSGQFAYSPVVFVEGIETLKVYPNPNKGTFTLETGKAEGYPARLLNAQGKEIWVGKTFAGKTTVSADLPTGMYFLHILKAGKAKIVKIAVER